jgi:hypothetical protein
LGSPWAFGSGSKYREVYDKGISCLCGTYRWQSIALSNSFESILGFANFPRLFQIFVRNGRMTCISVVSHAVWHKWSSPRSSSRVFYQSGYSISLKLGYIARVRVVSVGPLYLVIQSYSCKAQNTVLVKNV